MILRNLAKVILHGAIIVIILMVLTSSVFSQTNAVLLGGVTDPFGASLPNAEVSLRRTTDQCNHPIK